MIMNEEKIKNLIDMLGVGKPTNERNDIKESIENIVNIAMPLMKRCLTEISDMVSDQNISLYKKYIDNGFTKEQAFTLITNDNKILNSDFQENDTKNILGKILMPNINEVEKPPHVCKCKTKISSDNAEEYKEQENYSSMEILNILKSMMNRAE